MSTTYGASSLATIETEAPTTEREAHASHESSALDEASPASQRALAEAVRDVDACIRLDGDAAAGEAIEQERVTSFLLERAAVRDAIEVEDVRSESGGSRGARESEDGSSADAPFTRGAVALATAYRRAIVGERVRATLADKKSRGERIGTVPFGYRLATDGVHLVPDDAEQAVVAIVRALSREGHSQRGIVSRLAERGVAGRTGAPLRQTQVARILHSSN